VCHLNTKRPLNNGFFNHPSGSLILNVVPFSLAVEAEDPVTQ